MSGEHSSVLWSVIGESVKGASHVRSKRGNQDAIDWSPRTQVSPEVIVAVADGHGSSESFRSDRGSRLAVEAALSVVGDLFSLPVGQHRSLTLVKRAVEEELPRRIPHRWRESVMRDLALDPYTEEEIDRHRAGEADRRNSTADLLPYGATLITAVATPAFIAICQLGDGDALMVSDEDEATRVFPDEISLGDATTSLCLDDPWRYTRTFFRASFGARPALIVLSTDGFSNSFRDEGAFLEAVGSLRRTIANRGADETARGLAASLTEMSERGSGDDITLGIICREDAVLPRAEAGA